MKQQEVRLYAIVGVGPQDQTFVEYKNTYGDAINKAEEMCKAWPAYKIKLFEHIADVEIKAVVTPTTKKPVYRSQIPETPRCFNGCCSGTQCYNVPG